MGYLTGMPWSSADAYWVLNKTRFYYSRYNYFICMVIISFTRRRDHVKREKQTLWIWRLHSAAAGSAQVTHFLRGWISSSVKLRWDDNQASSDWYLVVLISAHSSVKWNWLYFCLWKFHIKYHRTRESPPPFEHNAFSTFSDLSSSLKPDHKSFNLSFSNKIIN